MREKQNRLLITTYKNLLQINTDLNQSMEDNMVARDLILEIRDKNIDTIQLIEKYIHKGVIKNDTNP